MCQRCLRAGRICPGYRARLGLVFRGMNRAAKMRADSRSGTRAAGPMTFVPSGSESLDSASWDMLQNVMQTARKPLGAVPLPLSWNWQDQAIARFFADYILPSDVFTENLPFLPRLCGSPDSCHHLKEALHAVAFASQGN
jgi:hypothetical protein